MVHRPSGLLTRGIPCECGPVPIGLPRSRSVYGHGLGRDRSGGGGWGAGKVHGPEIDTRRRRGAWVAGAGGEPGSDGGPGFAFTEAGDEGPFEKELFNFGSV